MTGHCQKVCLQNFTIGKLLMSILQTEVASTAICAIQSHPGPTCALAPCLLKGAHLGALP